MTHGIKYDMICMIDLWRNLLLNNYVPLQIFLSYRPDKRVEYFLFQTIPFSWSAIIFLSFNNKPPFRAARKQPLNLIDRPPPLFFPGRYPGHARILRKGKWPIRGETLTDFHSPLPPPPIVIFGQKGGGNTGIEGFFF